MQLTYLARSVFASAVRRHLLAFDRADEYALLAQQNSGPHGGACFLRLAGCHLRFAFLGHMGLRKKLRWYADWTYTGIVAHLEAEVNRSSAPIARRRDPAPDWAGVVWGRA